MTYGVHLLIAILLIKEAALSCDKLLVQDASDFLAETVIIKMVSSCFILS